MTVVIAHRGASADAPENTLAAVELAISHGADRVEVDVQRTADGELVLLHDADLRRTTDGHGPVAERTLAELRALDAGSWFDERFAGARIPTLAELLDLVRGRIGVHLELKDPHRYPGIERQVVAALGRGDDVLVQSFDHASVRRTHALAADVPLGLLVGSPLDEAASRDAAGFATEVNPAAAVLSPALVAAAHERGLRVSVWTVDEPDDLRRALAAGVDAIITNRPAALRRILTEVP